MWRRSRPATLALALATALAVTIAAVIVAQATRTSSGARAASAASESGFDGAALPPGRDAPSFTLIDQSGRTVSLGEYRGRVVVLTFLYSTCGATCVVIAQQIRGALDDVDDGGARPPAVVIVSAAPAVDSAKRVARFLAEVSLTGRVQYLTGPPARLRAIWRAYDVTPARSGRAAFDRSASVLLLDGGGRERVVFESEELTPESLSHDIGKLRGG